MLALRQCSTILAPILRGLILVIAVHPLTGILRRREALVWPAATVTLIALLAVILRLAASMALSVAQLFDEQGASDRDLGLLPAEPVRFAETLGLSATFLGRVGSSTRHAVDSSPNPRIGPTPALH